ncbi:MAG: hypothetical protein MJ215_05300 [Spirochaetia bacterium]|nr:hypothetical protein [Spirochaetia bacterium]
MINTVTEIDDKVTLKNVLISVSDKTGLDAFVKGLVKINPSIRIYSTGGTFSYIKDVLGADAEKNLIQVSDYTKQPEMQGGLVKTLDFKIYLGILSETYNDAHKKDIARTNATIFDMIVVNLYPFEKTVAKAESTSENARGNIDIGGPCMLRASAKNFLRVASVVDPEDYPVILKELEANKGAITFAQRFELAKKTFKHTAAYDTAISAYLAGLSAADAAKVYNLH